MCVCMCVYACSVCMCVCVHVCMCVTCGWCMCTYVCVHGACVHMCVYVCVCMYAKYYGSEYLWKLIYLTAEKVIPHNIMGWGTAMTYDLMIKCIHGA